MNIGTVTYDSYGVPTLKASSVKDLSYLQGFISGRDNARQVDHERRRSYGTTAAVLGTSGVMWDRMARQIDLPAVAKTTFDRSTTDQQEWLTAFSEGVNAGLAQYARQDRTSPESLCPEAWTPWDSLSLMLGHHLTLTNFPAKLFRGELINHGYDELAHQFTFPSTAGSNAWFIPEHRTHSNVGGILAADPHRIWENGGCYHQVRLVCPEVDVVGLAFPGVPGVPHFGHNGHVAWVTTSAMANTQDLFVLGGDAPRVTPHTEAIEVAGADTHYVEVADTAHGRLLTVAGQDFAYRHPAAVLSAIGVEAHAELLLARTAEEAAAACDLWVEPVNRMIFSDTTGNTLSRWVGKVPKRSTEALIRPVAATPDNISWTEWLDTSTVQQHDDFVVHANEPAAPESVSALSEWSVDFCSSARHDRIIELITRGHNVSMADVIAWQHDVQIPLPQWWGQALAVMSTIDPHVADDISHWPGAMTSDSLGASWFAAIRHHLVNVVADSLPVRTHASGFGVFQPWCEVRAWLPDSLDQLLTSGVVELPSLADLIHAAVHDAVDSQPTNDWGRAHRPLLFDYDGAQDVPQGVESSGDAQSICATSSVPGVTHRSIRGPVARVVWDVTNRENSQWLVPTGSPREPKKQWHAWSSGVLVPLPCDVVSRESMELPISGSLGGDALSARYLRVQHDLSWVTRWVREDRAEFWGMRDLSDAEIQSTYEWLEDSADHTIVVVSSGDQPAFLAHFYNPKAEPIGDVYDVKDGDVGLHIFSAPAHELRIDSTIWAKAKHLLLNLSGAQRLVVEPDVKNKAAVAAAFRMGFREDRVISVQTPDGRRTKEAVLCFLELKPLESS